MSAVVDANILKAFYEKTVLEIEGSLTACPEEVIEGLEYIYLDDGGQIEHEWRSLVDPEWFESWLSNEMAIGNIGLLQVDNHAATCKKIYKIGFPRGSKDIWYVRTAKQVSISQAKPSVLITEDIDFFDPTKKGTSGEARIRVLKSKNSKLKKLLYKEEDISVLCLCEYLA